MNRKSIPVILILLVIFSQCRKDKTENENPAPDLQKDLLAYFRMNGNFSDSTKNIQNVSYGGFLNDSKDRHGYANRAIFFNGGLLSFQTDEWTANPITISLWVKPKDLNNDNYLVLSHEGAFGVYQQGSKIGLAVSIPNKGTALSTIDTGWTHFAGTYDGKDIKTYINGKLANTLHHPGTADITTNITVGAKDIPEWKGVIDDLRFYKRVLTAQEIQLLHGL